MVRLNYIPHTLPESATEILLATGTAAIQFNMYRRKFHNITTLLLSVAVWGDCLFDPQKC